MFDFRNVYNMCFYELMFGSLADDWKANGANKSKGRGTRSSIFLREVPKGFVKKKDVFLFRNLKILYVQLWTPELLNFVLKIEFLMPTSVLRQLETSEFRILNDFPSCFFYWFMGFIGFNKI